MGNPHETFTSVNDIVSNFNVEPHQLTQRSLLGSGSAISGQSSKVPIKVDSSKRTSHLLGSCVHLYACADIVPVTEVTPGSMLTVFSKKLGQISDVVLVNATTMRQSLWACLASL